MSRRATPQNFASPVSSPSTRTASNATSSMTRRTQSIPLPSSHVRRTESELQLSEDMEVAEQKDLNMFYRLVNGIRERQITLSQEGAYTQQSYLHDQSLASIIHTRNMPVRRRSSGLPTLETIHAEPEMPMMHQQYNAPLRAQHQSFLPQPVESGETVADDWSVSGFEGPDFQSNNGYRMSNAYNNNYSYQANDHGSYGQQSPEPEDHGTDEEIFDLDL